MTGNHDGERIAVYHNPKAWMGWVAAPFAIVIAVYAIYEAHGWYWVPTVLAIAIAAGAFGVYFVAGHRLRVEIAQVNHLYSTSGHVDEQLETASRELVHRLVTEGGMTREKALAEVAKIRHGQHNAP